ncbi:hypothetical protein [Phaeobacter piscinae]|uniref:hypothetical protein n=1 Tax=Phaeobacter piscinae TaxID=1580596 RepID=UPI000BBE8B5A|nr:hypothetical protein [Phaeobacter piscinae]ATG40425.1 hypothetical protein PhaeoP14_02353 [Phaeobacter piscinae]
MFDADHVQEVTRSPLVGALDLSMFSDKDILNTVLQRSEVLFDLDRPGLPIRQWSKGKPDALQAEVARRGDLLLRRAISVLYLEYLALKPTIATLAPKHVADIGCGYGFIDLFIARDFQPALTLIDLESNDATHFGFHAEGAAYSSLATARAFLLANGVAAEAVTTLNPGREEATRTTEVDLALSLLSCGFHYPANTYAQFWGKSVTKDGAIILDLRDAEAARQREELGQIGALRDLWRGEKWTRVLIDKGAG